MHDTWKSATAAFLSYYFSAALNRWLSALFAKSNTVQTLKYCKSGPKNPEIRKKTPQFNFRLFASQSDVQICNFSPLQL